MPLLSMSAICCCFVCFTGVLCVFGFAWTVSTDY